MWLREQGHVFDWGTLKWCQSYSTAPNGCYDAETIAIDEFGHVEILEHHVNWANDPDYSDAVVQTYSRAKPSTGWNAHAFGRCDVATLQIRADVDEQNAPLVVAGQAGTAFLKGSNDKKMPLRFIRIEPFVVPKKSLTGDSSERVDTRVLQII